MFFQPTPDNGGNKEIAITIKQVGYLIIGIAAVHYGVFVALYFHSLSQPVDMITAVMGGLFLSGAIWPVFVLPPGLKLICGLLAALCLILAKRPVL